MEKQSNKGDKNELAKKVVFALTMGAITTGLISFVLIAINVGFVDSFFSVWLKSWSMAYLLVIPAILFIAPLVERAVHRVVDKIFE